MSRNIKTLKREYHPDFNPLVDGVVVTTKEKRISSGMRKELIDPMTGEVQQVAMTHQVKMLDDAAFVKVFSEGIRAMYGLSKAGTRVFQVILDEYQKTKMSAGYTDKIYLSWFHDGLNGCDVGMSLRTFNRGIAELIENKFLAPRSPETYWVNPSLFFKGDRVAFINEYRRKTPKLRSLKSDEAVRLELEAQGQARLLE